MHSRAPSLAGRAALAIALMVGFYVLAIALAGALLYVPYGEYQLLHTVTLRLALACVAGAFAILISIAPRIDRFEAPGPVLTATTQPRLFAVLDEIAAASKQSRPKAVYLIADVNAWVSQRGGLVGIGSKRVMAIGLPLLETLTVAEMRGVIAHEYGHYHGGDTALGPWIYKTRAAIVRTLKGLSGHHAWLQKPFALYGNGFLRVTLAISRRQEYAADALAARLVGTDAVASGLRALHAADPIFTAYWQADVDPALTAGFLPPVLDGFRAFRAQPGIAEMTTTLLAQRLEHEKSDPYDTHPPLRDRLAALDGLPRATAVASDGDGTTAIGLLDDIGTLEAALASMLAPKSRRKNLRAIAWADVGAEVWIPQWQRMARAKGPRLGGLTMASLGSPGFEFQGLAAHLGIRSPDPEQRINQLAASLGAPIMLAFHQRGWALDTSPGKPVMVSKDGVTLVPFLALEQLATGQIAPDTWRSFCDASGIAEVDLSTMVPAAQRAFR